MRVNKTKPHNKNTDPRRRAYGNTLLVAIAMAYLPQGCLVFGQSCRLLQLQCSVMSFEILLPFDFGSLNLVGCSTKVS